MVHCISGGVVTTAPIATDNVYTDGFVLTVDGNYVCNNVTVTSVTGALTVATGWSLTINGSLTGDGNWGQNPIGGTGTIIMANTSGADFYSTGHAIFSNLVINPGAGNTVTSDPNNDQWIGVTATGIITIASGTFNIVRSDANNGINANTNNTGTVIINSGATLSAATWAYGVGSNGNAVQNLVINGNYYPGPIWATYAQNITISTTGYMKVPSGTWWNTVSPPNFICNGTTEYDGTNQNLFAGNYHKLILSGGGTKTLQGTTGVDSIHFVQNNSCTNLSLNSQTLNIPHTVVGITGLTGTNIVSGTREYAFFDYYDVMTNLSLRNVGAGGAIFNFLDGETFTINDNNCPFIIGTYSNPVTFGRTGAIGAANNPILTVTNVNNSEWGNSIICIANATNVTVNGLNLSTSPFSMEFGIAIGGGYSTGACSNITIENCIISLANTTRGLTAGCAYWQDNTGIWINNSVVETNIQVYSNTITNVEVGISFCGWPGTTRSTGLQIGAFKQGNRISNFTNTRNQYNPWINKSASYG